jgi:hypothetical protein
MIGRSHSLPITRQAEVLGMARSTVYAFPTPVSERDFDLMKRIDRLHLEMPYAGSRMLRDLLNQDGIQVGRKHVATLMKRMGIEALYRKPKTTKKHPQHRVALCIWWRYWTGTHAKSCRGESRSPWTCTFALRRWKKPLTCNDF